MKCVVITDNKYIKEWNTVAIHPLQKWEWGEARKSQGIDVLRIMQSNNASYKATYQVTFHRLPRTNFTIGYLPRSTTPTRDVFKTLYLEGKKRNCIGIKIEPYVEYSDENIKYITREITQSHMSIQKSKNSLFPQTSLLLDLSLSDEKLLSNMKSKTRYNIKIASKHGVKVVEMTNDKGFDIFIDLYFKTCTRQGYRGHTKSYHQTIYNYLKNSGLAILIAYYKNKPLAAYELFYHNNTLFYPYGGSSFEYKQVMAPTFLMWEAIRYGKKKNLKYFDMWGSAPENSTNHPWSGFTKFKLGFGAEYISFIGTYDLIVNQFLYTLFEFLFSFRFKLM